MHATGIAEFSWWIRVPRSQSRRWPEDAIRERRRLSGLRKSGGRDLANLPDANLCFLHFIQSLARRRLAGVGRRPSRIHAANDEHARQTLERTSPRDWLWPFVPGPLQVFSCGNRGLFLPSRPLRRAKCLARQFGGSCRGLALVQSEARGTRGSRLSNTLRVAAAQASRLAGTRQPAAVRS